MARRRYAVTSDSDPKSARPARLLELFEGRLLTATQRRISHSIVTHADEAPYLSVTELAELAHASQPSVTRFALAMGYEGFAELRQAIRDALADTGNGNVSASDNEWQRALSLEIASLEAMRTSLSDQGPLRAAAKLIAKSRPLCVLGLNAAGPVAQYFSYFAAKVLPDVRTISGLGATGIEDGLEQAREAGGKVLLTFVFPPYRRDAIRIIKLAKQIGYEIICITDGPSTAIKNKVDYVFHAPVQSALVFDSLSTPMTLSMILLQAICDTDEAHTMRRLEEAERFAESQDLLVGQPRG